ncbi:MAG: AraC family transcriptional regulator [Spirochaetes bacterium]|nr:AraC family transcriptional regulator [Spirochaetota bacterium]
MSNENTTPVPLPFPLFFTYGSRFVFILNFLAVTDVKGHRVALHAHPYHECIIVRSGRLSYQIGNEKLRVARGDAIVIAPHEAHTRSVESPASFYAFHVMIRDASNSISVTHRFAAQEALLSACVQVIDESMRRENEWESAARHILLGALIGFARNIMHSGRNDVEKRIDPSFIAALRFVNNGIRTDLAVSDAAKAAGLSERHLTRLFRKNLGIPPRQYILEKKLSLAYSDLISDKRSTVRAIAQRLGFYDAGYFAKIIKKTYRMSPKQIQSQES